MKPRQGKCEVFLGINSYGEYAHSPCLGVGVSRGKEQTGEVAGEGALRLERERRVASRAQDRVASGGEGLEETGRPKIWSLDLWFLLG